MKDVIIEAGQKLGKYLREELDGRVTLAHVKKICAIATDILPGERYEQARGLLILCQKYHLLENYSESSFDRETRVKEITHTLVDRAMLAKSFALNAAALVVIICEGTLDAESFAKRLMEGETQKTEAPTPIPTQPQAQPQNNQPQTVQPTQTVPRTPTPTTPEAVKGAPLQTTPKQPTQPQKPNNPSDFYIVDGVLKAYRGHDSDVVIPDTVEGIAGKAFENCKFLKSVVVPNSVTSIGSGAFYGCSSLESITIPFVGNALKKPDDSEHKTFGFIFGTSNYGGAESIKQFQSAWYSIVYYVPKSLKHVTVTGGYMLDGAFDDCKNIETITFTPESDNLRVGINMFRWCKSLRSFTIPAGVQHIGTSAFTSCGSLKEMVVPSSVKFIGDKAFEYCYELEKVTIPKSVEEIGNDAFASCPKLTIYKEGGLKPWEIFGTKWNPNRRPVKKI